MSNWKDNDFIYKDKVSAIEIKLRYQEAQAKLNNLAHTIQGFQASDQDIKEWLAIGLHGLVDKKLDATRFAQGISDLKSRYNHTNIDSILRSVVSDYIQANPANQRKIMEAVIQASIPTENRNPYNKYGDKADYFHYDRFELENDLKHGELAMQGTEYIQRAINYGGRKEYTHLRTMLHKLWDIRNYMPADRIDIDSEFKYSAQKLAKHIHNCFSSGNIDIAHERARDDYANKGRGRPKGARNRDKVLENKSHKPDPLMDNLPDMDDDITITMDEADKLPVDAPKTEVPGNIDLSDYVQHDELNHILEGYTTHIQVNDKIALSDRDIISYINSEIEKVNLQKPTIVELKRRDLPNLELGVQHRHFPELLAMCNAATKDNTHLNVWVYGPAGTGKTTAARMVSKAMSLPFYMLGALETGFQILGYNDAHGNYVTTLFRKCWETGGIIILDEIDSYSPSAALALNGALANGHCAFPDAIIERHPDCIILAGANTTGLGGTIEYSGRMKQDAAFLDRFVMLDWPIDEALEAHICSNSSWLAIVQHCRHQVIARQIKGAMITPRATIYGDSLLAAGVSLERVIKSVIRKSMTDAQWEQIKPSYHLINECEASLRELLKDAAQ